MYNHLQEKKDETFFEEQVMIVQLVDSLQQNEEESEAPKDKDTVIEERSSEEYKNHDMTKPQRGIDPTRVMKTILGMKDHPR